MSEQTIFPILVVCLVIVGFVMIKSEAWVKFWQAAAGAAILYQIGGMAWALMEHLL